MSVRVKVPSGANGMILSEWLVSSGYQLSAHCGGRGVCGKCRVKVITGAFGDKNSPGDLLQPDREGYLLSCRAVCLCSEAEIILPDTGGTGLTEFEKKSFGGGGKGYGIAVDIGTTTVAAVLVDRSTGRIIGTQSSLNPQRSFGADVISRISAASAGKLESLRTLIVGEINRMISEFRKSYPDKNADDAVVSGNTTMLHLFCGVSPESMGVYPFTPVFTEMRQESGANFGLEIKKVTVLPSASAFIGSDITAGIAYCGLSELESPSLLVDIGTNGEMVICKGKSSDGKYYCASAAAGPALEGANISCGVGGINGAVCRVTKENGRIKYRTIGDKPVCGVCGSGLIDIIALMLDDEVIDETGYLEEAYRLNGEHITADGKPIDGEVESEIVITQKDVREFQLAKSAISAGIDALSDYAELKPEEIENVFIAGGLGFYMSVENAKRTGLIPSALKGKITAVGNTSLAGAISCLSDKENLNSVARAARNCVSYELNESPVFSKEFIENMVFPD